jgi:hypothetical protein
MGFVSGKYSQSICDRCGFRFKYRNIKNEPGTGWRVCESCNDRNYNLIQHPQNGPFPTDEDFNVRYPRPELPSLVTVGVSVSVWQDLTGWN